MACHLEWSAFAGNADLVNFLLCMCETVGETERNIMWVIVFILEFSFENYGVLFFSKHLQGQLLKR